jgi:hypothetical protein
VSDLPRIGGRVHPRRIANFVRSESTHVLSSMWHSEWPAIGLSVPQHKRQASRLYVGQAKVLEDMAPPLPEIPLFPFTMRLLNFSAEVIDESWNDTAMGFLRGRLAAHASKVAQRIFEAAPGLAAEIAGMEFGPGFVKTVVEVGTMPNIPHKVLDTVPAILEARIAMRMNRSPPPLMLSIGQSCIHVAGMGAMKARVMLPSQFVKQDYLLCAPCIAILDLKKSS